MLKPLVLRLIGIREITWGHEYQEQQYRSVCTLRHPLEIHLLVILRFTDAGIRKLPLVWLFSSSLKTNKQQKKTPHLTKMQNLGYKDGENRKFRTRKRTWAESTKVLHFLLTHSSRVHCWKGEQPSCLHILLLGNTPTCLNVLIKHWLRTSQLNL